MKRLGILLLSLLLVAVAARVEVAQFSTGSLQGWEERLFDGATDYTLMQEGGRGVLRASSSAAASGLFHEVQVDLATTPYLHWSWKVDNLLEGADERSRGGDDYPARVYVVFSGGIFFWRTRAVNYVWSSNQPQEAAWPNAYTGNARMIAVRSGPDRLGEWLAERRDVRADYRRLFGEEPGRVAAVALMTDTDNTGQSATAWYGDIWFDSE